MPSEGLEAFILCLGEAIHQVISPNLRPLHYVKPKLPMLRVCEELSPSANRSRYFTAGSQHQPFSSVSRTILEMDSLALLKPHELMPHGTQKNCVLVS